MNTPKDYYDGVVGTVNPKPTPTPKEIGWTGSQLFRQISRDIEQQKRIDDLNRELHNILMKKDKEYKFKAVREAIFSVVLLFGIIIATILAFSL